MYPLVESEEQMRHAINQDQVDFHSQYSTVKLMDVLEQINLAQTVSKLGGLDSQIDNIGNVLSIGEQQRLAFGRILLHRPRFVLMDESTSGAFLYFSTVGFLNHSLFFDEKKLWAKRTKKR
eukprot:TRINITY_DN15107_c0_g1_i1.p1 TRINITY_DN15107_c0_g1~~TRINITY_DN15107_c0_g1_i1.p1  ORF type:complete len:121 (+),score=25.54 TRINITY_DN15107_c0_g1_i1:80-442(+)